MIPIQRTINDCEKRMMGDTIMGHLILVGPYDPSFTNGFMTCQDVKLSFNHMDGVKTLLRGCG